MLAFHLYLRLEFRADLGFKFELKIERKAIDKKERNSQPWADVLIMAHFPLPCTLAHGGPRAHQ
jgi:hypothetical protein